MQEVWKSLKGLIKQGDNYSVSNLGRVRNDVTGKIKKNSSHERGYLTTGIGANSTYPVHRLVALAFHPNPDNKPQVNHIDGNKVNNEAANLEWVTPSENIIHAIRTGLQVHRRGEKHHSSKFTEKQVIEIKQMLAKGMKGATIAREFDVPPQYISWIKTGHTWRHVHVEGFEPTYKKNPRGVS
ncbi:HNH endonuclease [Bacillus phage Bobb]|uniref:HNH homing endonuclease n=1 Tax=Bacillus phage Bobb TaxID=1527469 RepID=A0A076GD96_9CAUD|nr:HNH endonuclease [Bacillus phage Bobb]AII27975.1 HNH homing endonuclease [Bacillus phage Bobb]